MPGAVARDLGSGAVGVAERSVLKVVPAGARVAEDVLSPAGVAGEHQRVRVVGRHHDQSLFLVHQVDGCLR